MHARARKAMRKIAALAPLPRRFAATISNTFLDAWMSIPSACVLLCVQKSGSKSCKIENLFLSLRRLKTSGHEIHHYWRQSPDT